MSEFGNRRIRYNPEDCYAIIEQRISFTNMTATEWISKMMNELNRLPMDMRLYTSHNHETIVAVYVSNHWSVGTAKCSPTDIFDWNTGIAIAYARAMGYFVHPAYQSKEDEARNWSPVIQLGSKN